MPKKRKGSEPQHAIQQNVARQGECRIIAGKWRGRKIRFDDAEGLRPTTDRIRETVFNWLQAYLPNSNCLDCFAGSGALGFEALSRGADKVVFVEHNKNSVAKLKKNIQGLDADNAVVIHDDALHWLQVIIMEEGGDPEIIPKFDLVFLDPPFRTETLEQVSNLLNRSGCLAVDALIYVEHAVDDIVELPEDWACLKQKQSGQVVYSLFEKQCGSEE